jgi:hypothetical protein
MMLTFFPKSKLSSHFGERVFFFVFVLKLSPDIDFAREWGRGGERRWEG